MLCKLASTSDRNCISCFYSRHYFSHLYISSQHDYCHWYSQWNTFLCSYCSSKCRYILFAFQYSKFAKIIGKGNPVAVLDTMILLSSAKFLNAVLPSFSLLYWKPALGSRNVDITVLGSVKTIIDKVTNSLKLSFISCLLHS